MTCFAFKLTHVSCHAFVQVTVRFLCEDYIQNNAQLFATFGLSGFPLTEKAAFIGSPQFSPKDFTALGAPIATGGCPRNPDTHKYAGYATQITLPKSIDSLTNTNYNATSFKQETQTLSTALWGTVGASGLLTEQVFRVNITVVPNEAA